MTEITCFVLKCDLWNFVLRRRKNTQTAPEVCHKPPNGKVQKMFQRASFFTTQTPRIKQAL